jgi:ssDNA-binding Zn-finger/Zn-ribbon topoisomerase 1
MSGRNWDRVRTEATGRNDWEHIHPPPSKKQKNTPPMPMCPLCNSGMARRIGKFGVFWGCTRFPRCQGTSK